MAPMRLHALGLLAFLWTLPFGQAAAPLPAIQPAVERIADGVELHRLTDPSLLNPAGPVAVHALRLDPRKVTLETAVAEDRLPARETVAGIAARRTALAAVNGGFFALENGAPTGLLKVRGTVVGGTTRARGAVAFLERGGRTRLLFDRVIVNRARRSYAPSLGSPAKDWERAGHAVGGAGLLLLDGRVLEEWGEERIAQGFDTTRHPRTMIGDDGTAIWLITVDGRQPLVSLGMSFSELQGLAARLGLALRAQSRRRRIDDDGDPRRGREPSVGSGRSTQGERRRRRSIEKVARRCRRTRPAVTCRCCGRTPPADALTIGNAACGTIAIFLCLDYLADRQPALPVDGVPAVAAGADPRRARRLRRALEQAASVACSAPISIRSRT